MNLSDYGRKESIRIGISGVCKSAAGVICWANVLAVVNYCDDHITLVLFE